MDDSFAWAMVIVILICAIPCWITAWTNWHADEFYTELARKKHAREVEAQEMKDLWEARALERDNAEEERAALEAALERAERRRTSVA
ncbi:hypothetical protein V2G26_000410 [Clonostachys chloroleuca]